MRRDRDGSELKGTSQPQPGNGKKVLLFTYAISRWDFISFLPRRETEELRTVSSRWNYSVVKKPEGQLPRFKYSCLEVMIGEGGGCQLTEDGYVPESEKKKVRVPNIKGIPIQDPNLSNCCQEIQLRAGEELDGQLVFLQRGEQDIVVLRVKPKERWIAFRAPNMLTKATAGGLVHFLHHLDECYVRELEIQDELPALFDEHGGRTGALNGCIFTVYEALVGKPLTLCAKKIDLTEVDAPHNSTEMLTARQLVAKVGAITWYTLPADVESALAFLSTARRFCSKVVLGLIEPHMLDRVIAAYCDCAEDVLVQKVDVGGFHGVDWPTSLPLLSLQVVMKEKWAAKKGMEHSKWLYIYTITNTASGRSFQVTMHVHCERSIEQRDGQVVHGEERAIPRRAMLRLL